MILPRFFGFVYTHRFAYSWLALLRGTKVSFCYCIVVHSPLSALLCICIPALFALTVAFTSFLLIASLHINIVLPLCILADLFARYFLYTSRLVRTLYHCILSSCSTTVFPCSCRPGQQINLFSTTPNICLIHVASPSCENPCPCSSFYLPH